MTEERTEVDIELRSFIRTAEEIAHRANCIRPDDSTIGIIQDIGSRTSSKLANRLVTDIMAKAETPLSEKLRKLLKDQPDSLKQLAAKAGVGQPSLSRFVKGERDLKFDTVARVLDVLGYDLCPSTSTDSPSKSTASGRKLPSPSK